jgi:hypothetical protein
LNDDLPAHRHRATVQSEHTVRSVVLDLARDPVSHLVRRWNWKSATLSAAIRGTIFLLANLSAGPAAALRAMLVEILFVATTNGVYAALTQALSIANPFWAASVTVMLLVPALAHSVELLFHWIAGTPQLQQSVVASFSFSAVSALFNVFAMRRGVLIVGRSSRSFTDDLRRLPLVFVDFLRHAVKFTRMPYRR